MSYLSITRLILCVVLLISFAYCYGMAYFVYYITQSNFSFYVMLIFSCFLLMFPNIRYYRQLTSEEKQED